MVIHSSSWELIPTDCINLVIRDCTVTSQSSHGGRRVYRGKRVLLLFDSGFVAQSGSTAQGSREL